MAYATRLTIGTGTKISLNYNSEDFSVSLSYELERPDTDLLQVAEEKAAEVEKIHRMVRHRINELRQQEEKPQSRQVPAVQEPSAPQPVAQEPPTPVSATQLNGGSAAELISEPQRRAILALINKRPNAEVELAALLEIRFQASALDELTKPQATALLLELQRTIRGGGTLVPVAAGQNGHGGSQQ